MVKTYYDIIYHRISVGLFRVKTYGLESYPLATIRKTTTPKLLNKFIQFSQKTDQFTTLLLGCIKVTPLETYGWHRDAYFSLTVFQKVPPFIQPKILPVH